MCSMERVHAADGENCVVYLKSPAMHSSGPAAYDSDRSGKNELSTSNCYF
jgi:hypothetical protein